MDVVSQPVESTAKDAVAFNLALTDLSPWDHVGNLPSYTVGRRVMADRLTTLSLRQSIQRSS